MSSPQAAEVLDGGMPPASPPRVSSPRASRSPRSATKEADAQKPEDFLQRLQMISPLATEVLETVMPAERDQLMDTLRALDGLEATGVPGALKAAFFMEADQIPFYCKRLNALCEKYPDQLKNIVSQANESEREELLLSFVELQKTKKDKLLLEAFTLRPEEVTPFKRQYTSLVQIDETGEAIEMWLGAQKELRRPLSRSLMNLYVKGLRGSGAFRVVLSALEPQHVIAFDEALVQLATLHPKAPVVMVDFFHELFAHSSPFFQRTPRACRASYLAIDARRGGEILGSEASSRAGSQSVPSRRESPSPVRLSQSLPSSAESPPLYRPLHSSESTAALQHRLSFVGQDPRRSGEIWGSEASSRAGSESVPSRRESPSPVRSSYSSESLAESKR